MIAVNSLFWRYITCRYVFTSEVSSWNCWSPQCLSHRCIRICSYWRNIFSFPPFYLIYWTMTITMSNTEGATFRTGIVYPSTWVHSRLKWWYSCCSSLATFVCWRWLLFIFCSFSGFFSTVHCMSILTWFCLTCLDIFCTNRYHIDDISNTWSDAPTRLQFTIQFTSNW